METPKQKKSPLKFFLGLLLLILFVLVIVFLFLKSQDIGEIITTYSNNTNTSLITVQQNIDQTTIDQTGQSNIWDFGMVAFVGMLGVGLIAWVSYLLFKFIGKRKLIGNKRKKECEAKAFEELRQKSYDISNGAKQSFRYYGTDSDTNPAWAFVFFKTNVNPIADINTVSKFDLVSCRVDAKTLEVFNETHGKDLKDIEQDLNKQRFGKESVPNFAGKTEKAPSFDELFESKKPTVSFSMADEEEGE